MRLKYQIFITMLAASASLIVIMYAISSWSFSRGFVDYVNQNELSRLSPIAERLVYEYEQNGDWDWADKSDLRQFKPNRNRRGQRPPGGRDRDGNTRPPPLPNREQSGLNNRPKTEAPGKPRPGPPLVLADKAKNALVGSIKPKVIMQWVNLESDDQIIGYLGFPKNTRADRQFDRVFAQKQKNTFGLTALAMILFSALVSIPLAGRIVRPLLKVNKAVDEISGGNYTHRLDSKRRDELGDLAENINTLGNTLEKNRDARQRWIAEISHELRTPLAVMRGEIEAIQDGVRALDQSALESLHTEAMNLGRLVDDLHTLSMSDVGALNYQLNSIDLSRFVQSFIKSNKTTLMQHAIEYSITTETSRAVMQGDTQRLDQLFTNLLQNTCRYTDHGGKLQIKIKRIAVAGQAQLQIDWFDSSPGVDVSALSQLFDPLFRTEDSRNRELGGSGLGLSIAKRIVEAHQGTISASDSSLGGLHIKIVFPASSRTV